MSFMEKIKNFMVRIKHFINSLYYFKSILAKNVYPCRLIGEKIDSQETIILYKIRGQQNNSEILLQQLLNNKKLIEKFHSADAVKLGIIAFKDIILSLDKSEQEQKFYQIKNIMLNSIHDIYPSKYFTDICLINSCTNNSIDEENYLDLAVRENKYPCKLVASKTTHKKNCTTIVFTILGKREGHEKSLSSLLADNELLEKFHPTEAIKFGFIDFGDSKFSAHH
ncbi:MAG TPA: hypothetical protein VLI69_00675 [Gammaproteobacteria bacterium]|nr:hypothetical protein [Gammaproteobacteria bacterium]